MNTRIFSIVLLIMMIITNQSRAQKFQSLSVDLYIGEYEVLSSKLNYSHIKGSPYLNDDLILGQVIFKNGDSVSYYLRYDMYSDEIEYLQNKRLFTIVNMAALNHINLNGQKFVYQTYYDDGERSRGYLVQLVTNQCSLYRKNHVEFEDAQMGQARPFREASPAQFKPMAVHWYYACDTSPITEISLNSAGLRLISNKHFDKLRTFVKANKLKTRKEDDLVTLIEYFNELLKE